METSLIQRQARGPQAVLTELLLPVIGPRMSATSFPLSDAVAVSSTSLGPDLANIYLHARYYDAALGIFLSPDPIGADSNTYRYAGGDPVNYKDPSGLCAELTDSEGNLTGVVVCSDTITEVGIGGYGSGSFTETFFRWLQGRPQAPQTNGQCAILGVGCDDTGSPGSGAAPGPAPAPGPTPTPDPTRASNAEVLPEVAALMKDFVTGSGPERTRHGRNSAITRQLMSAPAINDLRSRFEKSDRKQPLRTQSTFGALPIGGGRAAFGIPWRGDDSPFASLSLARQFVGSFSATVSPGPNGSMVFVVDDSKSAWSLFAHQVPSFARAEYPGFSYPLSTTYQTYTWTEGGR